MTHQNEHPQDLNLTEMKCVLDATSDGLYVIDLQGCCRYANRACLRILGYGEFSELQGQEMHPLVQHLSSDGTPQTFESSCVYETLHTEKEASSDRRTLWRKDGTSFPARVRSRPIHEGGKLTGVAVIFRDLTKRQRAAASHAHLAAIVDHSFDAIIGKTLDGTITSWNRGAEQAYGYLREEVIGKNIEIVIPPEVSAAELEMMDALSLQQLDTQRLRKDGSVVDVSITVSPIQDGQGRIVGTSSIARDITSRMIEAERLEEAKQQAEDANRAKDEFVANISHELRTPMNAIIGMLDLSVRDPELTPGLSDYLETALSSARLMLALVNDLLDFSRLEVGHFELDEEIFSIRRVVDDSLRALALRANEQGLELAYRVDDEVPDALLGDARRLRQVLLNLVGNSIKFTEQGEIVVWVTVGKQCDNEVQLQIAVSDTGIGISADALKTVFAPFTQIDSSSTRKHAGAGLGLTICRDFIERMGGVVTIDSQVDRGTTVCCTPTFQLAKHAPDEFPARLPVLRGRNVLVVEDNDTARDILTETLASWEMNVFTAGTGEEACDIARERKSSGTNFEFSLIDSKMPHMDGLDLVQMLVEEDLLPITTILTLASGERQSLAEQIKPLPISACLEKPISPSGLLEALLQVAPSGTTLEATGLENRRRSSSELRILVTEDTPANQKVIRSILATQGYEVELASNGADAVAAASITPFDVILMDIQMPVMDGFTATRIIRSRPSDPNHQTPIIALTAHARKQDRLKCLEAGMDAYLAKPINASEIIRLVEHFSTPHFNHLLNDATDTVEPIGETVVIEAETVSTKPPPSSSTDEVMHLQVALRRMDGDMTLIKGLAEMFIADTPQMLIELKQHAAENETEDLFRVAHSLKGLASNFEALSCVDAAAKLEDAASRGHYPEGTTMIEDVVTEVTRLSDYLREHLLA